MLDSDRFRQPQHLGRVALGQYDRVERRGVRAERITKELGELRDREPRTRRVFRDERRDGSKCVEQEVRIQWVTQRLQLGFAAQPFCVAPRSSFRDGGTPSLSPGVGLERSNLTAPARSPSVSSRAVC